MKTPDSEGPENGRTWPPRSVRVLFWSRVALLAAAAYWAYVLWPLFRAPIQ